MIRYVLQDRDTIDAAVDALTLVPCRHRLQHHHVRRRYHATRSTSSGPHHPGSPTGPITANRRAISSRSRTPPPFSTVEQVRSPRGATGRSSAATVVDALLREPMSATKFHKGFGTLFAADTVPTRPAPICRWTERASEHFDQQHHPGALRLLLSDDRPNANAHGALTRGIVGVKEAGEWWLLTARRHDFVVATVAGSPGRARSEDCARTRPNAFAEHLVNFGLRVRSHTRSTITGLDRRAAWAASMGLASSRPLTTGGPVLPPIQFGDRLCSSRARPRHHELMAAPAVAREVHGGRRHDLGVRRRRPITFGTVRAHHPELYHHVSVIPAASCDEAASIDLPRDAWPARVPQFERRHPPRPDQRIPRCSSAAPSI